MSPTYKSLEDGQEIVTDEPRPDLDALARWERYDHVAPSQPTTPAPPADTTPVAAIVTLEDGTVVGDSQNVATLPVTAEEPPAEPQSTDAPAAAPVPAEVPAPPAAPAEATTQPVDEPKPRGNSSRSDWVAYALTKGATADELADLTRDEIAEKHGN